MTLTMAGVIGSVLPDIDLEKAVPSRLLFTGLGFLLSFMVLFTFKASYSILELWIIWLGVFIGIRYIGYNVFHRSAIHRGIFHSILAGLFFMTTTAIICAYALGLPATVSWMTGMFVLLGFLIHLMLDEIYSVDFTGARIKRSFGTALKLFDSRSPSASILMTGALCALLIISPPSAEFLSIMKPSQVTQFFRERLLPQDGWFKARMAQAAIASENQQTAEAGRVE
jgi:hypothetical protein